MSSIKMSSQPASAKKAPLGLRLFMQQVIKIFEPRDHLRLCLQLVMMIVGGVAELLGLILVPILIVFLTVPETIAERLRERHFENLVPLISKPSFFPWFVAGLAGYFVLKNLYLAFVMKSQTGFLIRAQTKLYRRLLSSYLYAPYRLHLKSNAAALSHVLSNDVAKFFAQVVIPLFSFLTELIVFALLCCLLMAVNPLSFFVAAFVVGGSSAGFYLFQRRKIAAWGREQKHYGPELVRIFNQSFGGIKEIKVLGRENTFIGEFERIAKVYVQSTRQISAASSYPKYFIESVAMVAISIMIGVMAWQGKGGSIILHQIALFAAAAIRLAPSLNRMVAASNSILGNHASMGVVLRDLDHYAGFPPPETTLTVPAAFESEILFRKIHYTYEGTDKEVLKDVEFSIPKGSSVALVGHSGAGKSTLADLFLGLLSPDEGAILRDGKNIQEFLPSWQRKIGYVPQSIYLADDTVRKNIAFGVPEEEIDEKSLWEAAEAAQLRQLIEELPGKMEEHVGERGIRLSGGQRQRIAIARALYHRPEFLVMDEATSALDNQTEKEITAVINKLHGEKTILIIAHRLSTVRNCDKLIFLEKGKVVGEGSYDHLLNDCAGFRTMVQSAETK